MTKWRKMNSAPRDGTWILVGLWVLQNSTIEPYRWQQYVVYYDTETSSAVAQDSEVHWSWERYDAWTVIPKPPHWGKE